SRHLGNGLLAECRLLFRPHPNLSDDVNRNIVQSEIEGGVFLGDLPPSTILQIHTQPHCYTMLLLGGGNALIRTSPVLPRANLGRTKSLRGRGVAEIRCGAGADAA